MAKTVLITGAGSGFGRDAALELMANGQSVIAAVHHAEQIPELKSAAAARGGDLRVEKLDLLSEADRQAAAGWDIDVLVNNAAIGEGGPISEIPLDLVRRVFEVNVFGTLSLTQGVVRRMVERGRGRVIFVSSIAGLTAGSYLGAYAASKHALEGIAESMSNELAPHGVQVATLNPGPYGTGFNDEMVRSRDRWYDPARHFTRPQDMARLDERFATQHDPADLVKAMVHMVTADSGRYRNVHPQESEDLVRQRQRDAWTRTQPLPGNGDTG
ncbi:SDR family oxidoreductase [Streptomyces sp. NBC_01244]|uniref:SDR family oxidoreductase n=1 Tax=Streptomyces sp. NBC_01244 TaxID=2903797 RepID=UPI002E0ECF91|nr:SDR family oxidoreductase [Streptomyces sp. NBC_01244]